LPLEGGSGGWAQPQRCQGGAGQGNHGALSQRRSSDAAEQDFINRSKGGVPDEIAEVSLPLGEGGTAVGIAALLKMAAWPPPAVKATA
jgi:hypothetical protein